MLPQVFHLLSGECLVCALQVIFQDGFFFLQILHRELEMYLSTISLLGRGEAEQGVLSSREG